jgi:hypothetical protein
MHWIYPLDEVSRTLTLRDSRSLAIPPRSDFSLVPFPIKLAFLLATFPIALAIPSVTLPQGGAGSNRLCTPADSIMDPNALCAKPLVGCLCVATGTATMMQIADCGGCKSNFLGELTCTYSTQPATIQPFSCLGTTVQCDGSTTCGIRCPCTNQPFYPILFTCGACQ